MDADLAFELGRGLSIVAFLGYGLACLFTQHMVAEFERYGLSHMRRFTGGLEVAGALGLAGGYALPVLTVAASAGLTLLMLLGLATRLRVRDPLPSTLPALALMAVNGFLCFQAYAGLSVA